MADPVKILHVEDNPDNRRLVRRVLVGAGYQVIDAADGLEGIELAVREQPDLILLDINMPRFDGYEAAAAMRAFPALQSSLIVALTAYTNSGDRERILTAGCNGYIAKPIDVDRFPQQVEEFRNKLRLPTVGEVLTERVKGDKNESWDSFQFRGLIVERMTGIAGEPTEIAVALARATRTHEALRTGSSVRGAIDMVLLARGLEELRGEAGFDTLPFLSHLLVLLAGDLISGRLLSLVGLPLTVLFFAARLFFLRLLTPGALPVFAILVVVRWKGHVRSLKRASSGEQLSENPAALGLGFSRSSCRWPHLFILRFARQTQRFEARGLHPAMQGFRIDDAHRGKMRCVSLRFTYASFSHISVP